MATLITSGKQLKDALNKKCFYLVSKMADVVKSYIDEFIHEFYRDYTGVNTPLQYERTWTLLNSVVKEEPQKIPDGYQVVVFIDTSLEYDSFWNGKHWTVNDTVNKANDGGQHGNYFASGHNLWDRAYEKITNRDIIMQFQQFMLAKGIDVKIR